MTLTAAGRAITPTSHRARGAATRRSVTRGHEDRGRAPGHKAIGDHAATLAASVVLGAVTGLALGLLILAALLALYFSA